MTDSEEDRSDIPFQRTPQLIEYVSGRPPSDSPYLSKSTAEYILNRAAKSGIEKGNERDIEDVLQDLPLRVTRLISDIAILSNGGYLDDLDQNWDLLRSIPGRPENLNLRKALRRQTVSSGETHYFDLGVDVGLALSALTGAQSEDSRGKEFLAGFRTAYSTDVDQKEHTEPSNNTNDFEIDPERKQILEGNGVEPTKYIARLIQDYNQGRHVTKGEGSISTEEATREYLEEHLDDWFWTCCKVRHKLEEEWSTIEEAGNPGMGAEETLSALWDLKFPPGGTKRTTSTAIAKQAGKGLV
ncbi:hypothetical protein PNP85_06340 [Halobacterium salinarum]|uniref:hypothetical protein n=1 Tax=Halobacterium salinarum TaxID=2242 RepID=UPI0025561C83|nr:hypothetical protein [Halobacterium salinarum]MDL0139120.1 hypothetical protein [Halobacterium salinarum]